MKHLACVILLAAFVVAAQAQSPSPSSSPSASPSPAASASPNEWVIYSTEIGWLRIGPRSEYEAKWAKKDEINGGTSDQPLKKTLLAPGFESRDAALKYLCDHVTKVQLRVSPPAAGGPARYLTGVLRGKEYSLRLTKGFDEETGALMAKTGKFYKALEYDWESEWDTVRKFNITPRFVFRGRQWLLHETGHGSVQGPVKEDRWMCSTSKPWMNEKHEYFVTLADGMGGTITYSIKEVEGPFMDNYTMARVMKKYRVDKVDLWPPVTSAAGRDVQPRVEAEKIPDKPRDYGDAALPAQPLLPNKALEDWVIYSIEDKWLLCSTRYDFNRPLLKRDVLWAGMSEEPAKKTLIAPPQNAKEPFRSRKQALRALVGELTEISSSFNPLNDPRETVTAKYRGQQFHLRIERGENGDFVVEGPRGGGYDYAGNVATLREINPQITPRKRFGKLWVVHATGHGTYSGPVKDDMWMTLRTEPDEAKHAFTIADGMGGTFGYSYDKGGGPFTDSYELVGFLKQINDPKVKSIGLYAEDRGVNISDLPVEGTPIDNGTPTSPPGITLKKITPESGMQGDTVGLLILAAKLETGCRGSLGPGIKVKDMTYFGRDAEKPELEQWVATAEIERDAPIGMRTLMVYNQQTSYGTMPKAFEVKERLADFCAPMEYVVPGGAKDWVFKQTSEDAATGITDPTEKEKFLKEIRDRRSRLLDAANHISDLQEQHRLKWSDLEDLVKDLKHEDSEKMFEFNVRTLEKRAKLEKEIRKIDADYYKAISPVIESFTDAEMLQLTESLQRRIECLYKYAAAALDEARKYNYTVSWEEFSHKKLLYDIHQENLVHALNGFQTVNSMRLLDAQRRIGAERTRIIRNEKGGLTSSAASLRPFQRRLRDAYIDMGTAAIMLGQAQAEAAMLDQESYLAGVYGITKQAKNIEFAKTMKTQSAQGLIFSMKYLVTGGTGLLGAGIDSVKRFFNFAAENTAGSSVFDTVSSEVTKQIKESREKTELMLNALNRIRGYDDERSTQLVTITDEGTKALNANRNFQEQTSGGLRRMAACYITDIPQLMNEELLMAREHAGLVAADMEKTFNAKVGANEKGEIPYKKLLTDPIGTIKVAIQDTSWGGDHFTPTIEYIAKRKGQLQEMDMLRQALERVEFDPQKLRVKLPKTYAFYLALEEDNPDFLQWNVTRERLAAQQRLDKIEKAMAENFEPGRRLGLQQMAARNRSLVLAQAADKQAHVYQLQGADKMMVWDYDGALECFYQAAEWNPKIQPLEKVEALREAIGWQKTIEAGMEVSSQVGNMGVQAAMFEFLGQAIGRVINVPGAPVATAETAAAEDVAAQASIWTRPIPGGGFAEFVWKQVNPFADFIKAGAVEREWKAIGTASTGLVVNIGTQVIQQDVLKKAVLQGYFGVDEQWADFFANAFVNTTQVKLGSGNSVLTEVAGWLKKTNEKFEFKIVDIPLWNERQEARRSLSDFHEYVSWLQEGKTARENVSGKKLVSESEANIKEATKPVAEAQEKIEKTLQPATKESLRELYDNLFPKNEKIDATERLVRIRKFFTGLRWKEHIMTLKLKKGEELSKQIDNMRRELVSVAQTEFFERPEYAKYKQYVVDYLYIGSAGKKSSKAYKETDSDIDFTLLVNEDTPETVRNELRDDFMKFFIEFGGKELEGFEMSIMVDPMPKFNKTGESAGGIVDAVFGETNPEKRAANRSELKGGIEKTIEQLVQNASDKERYLDRGNLFRHNVFVRLGCFLKKAVLQRNEEGAELVDESPAKYDELYGDVPLEPWMAFDAVVGNLGYIFQHALEHPHEVLHYQKVLSGKYAIRGALYSMLLMSPKARERLSKLSRAEVEAKGWQGAERIVVEVAKEILSQPDGMKELGLPTSLDIPGKKPLGMTPKEWTRLFEEWNYCKEGLPLNEVVGKPRNLKLDPDHRLVTALMAENIAKTEACFKAVLRKSMMEQGTELMRLRNARKDAESVGDPEAAQIFELKMKEIMLSQAAVWNRMSREQQNLVMKEIPPEADWWNAIADVEGLKETASSPAPTKENPDRVVLDKSRLQNWQPHVFRDQAPEEIARRIILLKERAKAAPPSVPLNVAPDPSLN